MDLIFRSNKTYKGFRLFQTLNPYSDLNLKERLEGNFQEWRLKGMPKSACRNIHNWLQFYQLFQIKSLISEVDRAIFYSKFGKLYWEGSSWTWSGVRGWGFLLKRQKPTFHLEILLNHVQFLVKIDWNSKWEIKSKAKVSWIAWRGSLTKNDRAKIYRGQFPE